MFDLLPMKDASVLNTYLRRLALALLVPVTGLAVLTAFNPTVTSQTPVNLTQRAAAEVSRITVIPVDRLTVVNQASLAGTEIKRFKIRDLQGKIYGVNLDAAGNPVSQEVVNQAIEAFNNRGFVGKLEAELANRLLQGSSNPISVVIWLKAETVAPLTGRTPAERQANLDILRTRYAKIQQPVVEQLEANGQQVIYQSLYSPVVAAAVTPQVIQRIAARTDVERIYLEKMGDPRADLSRVVQVNRPNHVKEVFPSEGSTQTSVPYVGAQLSFTAIEPAVLSEFQLFVDGVDVTTQSRISSTRDSAPSNASIYYTPKNLQPGTHHALVRFQIKNGRMISYNWSFSVKSP